MENNNHCEDDLDMVPTNKDSLSIGRVITVRYGKSDYVTCACSLCGLEKRCAESVISNSETETIWHVKALCDKCFEVGMQDFKKRIYDAATWIFWKGLNHDQQ